MASDATSAKLARLRLMRAMLTALLLAGMGVMLYPLVMRAYSQYRFVREAEVYSQAMEDREELVKDEMWEDARLYNEEHRANDIVDPFGEDDGGSEASARYEGLLNPLGNGQMGYVDIPRIGQRLNLYHGSSPEVLLEGVGHLEGTSLPVGGPSSHCVLSAHRGLPTAKLFTDLDQLESGDVIYLHVIGRTLAYEVDGTEVVEPTQVDALAIVPGEDRITLVTCTPYAVNTHRLLVHAHAVPYVPEEDKTGDVGLWVRVRLYVLLAAAVAFVIACVVVIVRLVRGRRERCEERPSGRHFRTS